MKREIVVKFSLSEKFKKEELQERNTLSKEESAQLAKWLSGLTVMDINKYSVEQLRKVKEILEED